MFGLKKSPLHKFAKHNSVDPGYPHSSSTNPFDSHDDLDGKKALKPSRRTSSEPMLTTQPNPNPFDDDVGKGSSSSSSNFLLSSERKIYKAEENTKMVNNCLKIAEDIREDATKTLVTLHQQGQQITRTHMNAADIDHDLSRRMLLIPHFNLELDFQKCLRGHVVLPALGEKLLGSLGGIFSKTWKPIKTRPITGPITTRDDLSYRKGSHMEQREKLGLAPAPKGRLATRTPPPEPTNALQKVEVEHAKQDDTLSDLSNLLDELKYMAVDMGTEIESHNRALAPMEDDVDVLSIRIKDGNQRARRLLGK
ncbi:SNAP25-likeous protein SNAP33 [Vitis vinifera]|uniref:SNAP25-likeous protein SNAP33 n=1 Tax=Vitis vinifera TaxID=29760 RepID=A0A438HG23_VITVI|nr:SNAP25-likeous protein SNAP33 [Vitis vinifera]